MKVDDSLSEIRKFIYKLSRAKKNLNQIFYKYNIIVLFIFFSTISFLNYKFIVLKENIK